MDRRLRVVRPSGDPRARPGEEAPAGAGQDLYDRVQRGRFARPHRPAGPEGPLLRRGDERVGRPQEPHGHGGHVRRRPEGLPGEPEAELDVPRRGHDALGRSRARPPPERGPGPPGPPGRARRQDRRRLQAQRAGRRRRHGQGLSRDAALAPPRRRVQDPARPAREGQGVPRPLHQRGARGRPARPPERRAGLRRRHRGRPRLLLHGVPRPRVDRGDPREGEEDPVGGGDPPGARGGARPRLRGEQGDRPPRHQARQPDAQRGRAGEDRRPGPREARRGERRRRGHRDAPLHPAGAGAREGGRPPRRPLQPRRDLLPDDHGEDPLHGQDREGDRPQAHQGAAARRVVGRPERPRRPRPRPREDAREGAGQALPVGEGGHRGARGGLRQPRHQGLDHPEGRREAGARPAAPPPPRCRRHGVLPRVAR